PSSILPLLPFPFFFFHPSASPEFSTLSLHDALPISHLDLAAERLRFLRTSFPHHARPFARVAEGIDQRFDHLSPVFRLALRQERDRKSTRLNSSHDQISYAVFCLKKKDP